MSLLGEILKWTETELRLWQRDAVRRLFQQEEGLSDDDYEELYTLLKVAHGLPNTKNLLAAPLTRAHLPTIFPTGESVILKTMRNLNYVNRIASGQKIDFAPLGITVIYGGNGTGKSGYARVLKRACRSRDKAEKVHPDVNDPNTKNRVPEATFDIEVGGTTKPVKWISGTIAPDELSNIAVFDCHCARVYVTSEQDVAYLPYGLDVVENLANDVFPELSRRLDIEMENIDVDRQPFNHLLGETEVGRLISQLSEKTDSDKLKDLSKLSDEEERRIAELNVALSEADPRAKADTLRLSVVRLKGLARRIEIALSCVDDVAIHNLKNLDDSVTAANRAEEQAAKDLQSGESLLAGTGEQVWKTLFDAARKFSTEVAYPEHEFPNITEGALCPLCQQPLHHVGERLRRFEEYVQNDVAKVAEQKRQELETAKTNLVLADLSVGLDEALEEELDLLDKSAVTMVRTLQTGIDERRVWMLSASDTHTWDESPMLSENPRSRIRNLAAQQLKSARIFSHAADAAKKNELVVEFNELYSRQKLSSCIDTVLSLIERMKKKKVLEACKTDLKTRPISDKSKVFARKAVTPALQKALESEFKALGIGHIKMKIQDRPDKGKMWYRLLLDLPSTHKVEEILSEGEQRAIAIGSFLAELKLANHSGGIVFDDPVSSLDHKHRSKVAKRLVYESQKRQVLVFTHDVIFLHQIQVECERLKISPVIYSLEMDGSGYFGNVNEGLPWDHKSYKERLDSLEKAQKRFEKLPWPTYPSEELIRQIIQQYSFLRATIERVVQDFVLNATVQRFRDYIEVKNLDKVVVLEKSDVDEINRLYQRCHGLVDAHDPSSAKNEVPPTPDELKNDIEDLKTLIQMISVRRKQAPV